MTHIISVWPLSTALEFADTVPCYESPMQSEAQAKLDYAAVTYHTAAAADTWAVKSPAYLISLDRPDTDGIGICEQCRSVVK